MWFITSREGSSAREIQRFLQLGSYKTAWALLHKLRRAMVGSAGGKLEGQVEVERFTLEIRNALDLFIAVEIKRSLGRIRMRLDRGDLPEFLKDAVDGSSSIRMIEPPKDKRYQFGSWDARTGPQLAALQLSTWLSRTHSGAIGGSQLDYYLDEFSFRFNHSKAKAGQLFSLLAEQAVNTKPAPVDSFPKTTD